MFKNIIIKNFRGITELAVGDFRRVNLLVGKNNCGKTSVLEALFLASAPTNPELPLRINHYRGFGIAEDVQPWHLFFNKLNTSNTIEIGVELQKHQERRELAIVPVVKPALSSSTDTPGLIYSGATATTAGVRLEASFSTKGKKAGKQKIVTEAVQSGATIQYHYPEQRPKNQNHLANAVFLNPRIGLLDVVTRFNNVQVRKETARLVRVLQEIEPNLCNLSLGSQGTVYCDTGLPRLLPIACLGDGIVRLFGILLAIWDTQGGIVLIDEIENGLYHSSQKVLWNAVFKAAQEFDVQIFATTHSMDCIKAFALSYPEVLKDGEDAARLYRIQKNGDEFKAVDYDYPTLKSSLESDWEIR